MTPFQCFLHPRRAAALIRREPFLPVELEDSAGTDDPDWTPKALETLAQMLGCWNDYYYPLIGAADMIRADMRRARKAE